MSVGRICSREVILASGDETVRTAAERMRAENVGTLVVTEPESAEPVGLLTDRDLALRVVADGEDPTATTVGEVMTEDPESVLESTAIEDALHYMRTRGHRRLIVTDEKGELVGILALDDILQLLSEEMADAGELLADQEPTSHSP